MSLPPGNYTAVLDGEFEAAFAVPTSSVARPSGTGGATIPEVSFERVELPAGVAAWNETLIWTGEELLFWGGEDASSSGIPTGEPGMAYQPVTSTWRKLAESPKPATYGAAGVWTGTEAIICCGDDSTTTVAYDPSMDSWRSLSAAPLRGDFAEAVWTGSHMLVVTVDGVAAYDPETDAWSLPADPPEVLGRTNEVEWSGTELIVWPSTVQRAVHHGFALDPETNQWRVLPEPPMWPAAVDTVLTGDSLIVWGGLPASSVGSERAVGSQLDLSSNAWSPLPEALPEPDGCECNLGSQTLLWLGDRLLVSTGHFSTGLTDTPLLLSYRPDADSWQMVGRSPA